MAGILSATLFEPFLTGPLLLALTRGPPEIQSWVTSKTQSLPTYGQYRMSTALVVTTLTYLFAAGVVKRISNFLDQMSFANWELSYSGKPWVWNQEIVVVTGGSGDIATAMVKKLIPKGVTVALLDIAPPRPEVGNSPKVHYYKCDMTSSKSVHEAAEKIKKELGTPSVLVNNAGLGNGASIVDITDEQLDRIFKVNIISHWYTVREFLPDMIKAKKGHVMTIASMASYTAVAGVVDYCATKSACLAFHEGLTQELRHLFKAPFIRTTIAHPFWVKTAMTAPIEQGIQKSDNLMTPDYVGSILAKAILSGKGGHLIIPNDQPKMKLATMVRGWPSWINSFANDTTKDNVLTNLAEETEKRAKAARDGQSTI